MPKSCLAKRRSAALSALCWLICTPLGAGERPTYHSPYDVAFSPAGRWLAVTDYTGAQVVLFDVKSGNLAWSTKMVGRPAGVAWGRHGRNLYVADNASDEVQVFLRRGREPARMEVGYHPVGLAVSADQKLLLAANSGLPYASVVATGVRHGFATIMAEREPHFLAMSPKSNLVVIGNRIPVGPATDESISATVTLCDMTPGGPGVKHVRLPPNSTNVLGVAVSPCGGWAYAVHNVGRAALPTEQIEYGWINANAMSVIDLKHRRRYATVLLDRPGNGAANPWGIDVSPDGTTAWLTLSGVHELGRLDLKRLHEQLEERLGEMAPERDVEDETPTSESLTRGASVYSAATVRPDDPTAVELVVSRLPPQYGLGVFLPGVFRRIPLPGNGPRAVDVSPDGTTLAVAQYYTGNVLLMDAAETSVTQTLTWGEQPPAHEARRGETIFHDADYCHERWLSCATCHPDGRADGLNWDLLNDGIGSPKNTRSLLLSHKTPPAMWHGVRADMETAVAAGFDHLLFREADPGVRRAVAAYLRSLSPRPRPTSIGWTGSDHAAAGQRIFESPHTRCAVCHPAPLFTDLKLHDVGTGDEIGKPGRYDTPTLVEIRRTAPYLHDGRAVTIDDVLRRHNRDDRHGRTSHLSDDEIEALVDYLQSL